MQKEKFIDSENTTYKIENKKRGSISYYSINQVADILKQDASNIKYYTNIFDDILKIEIVNKELRYKNNDINKLEFLLRLKNKGMTIKEIQDYYSKLPFNEEEEELVESNLLSVEELIESIKKEQELHFNCLKNNLISEIQNANALYLKEITSSLINEHNKSLMTLKDDLANEISSHITDNFDKLTTSNSLSMESFISSTNQLISDQFDEKSKEVTNDFHSDFVAFSNKSTDANDELIKEVRSFKRVIESAYYTHNEIESSNDNILTRFLQKINLR